MITTNSIAEFTYQIEYASTDHIEAIAKYNSEMALETEKKLLKPEIILEATKKVVEDPQFGFSIVALHKESLASFLNGCFFFDHTSNCLVGFINSVYVTKEHRKKGLFNKMFDELVDKSASEGAKAIRLYVDIDNMNAKKVYEAIGMKPIKVELYNVDLLSNTSNEIEFRSVYYELIDECEYSLEQATRYEAENLSLENLQPILSSDKTLRKTKEELINSYSSKYPTRIHLLKRDGIVIGMLGSYYFNCDWTDCRVWCINDIRVDASLEENAQELTAMMIQHFIEQDDYPNKYYTIMVKDDAEEWVKPMLKTCGAVPNHYNIYEKRLY